MKTFLNEPWPRYVAGPLFALIGNGFTIILVPLASAILGAWVYGYFRDRLPHWPHRSENILLAYRSDSQ